MCTVTLIPKGNTGFVLTTNRDEAPDRTSLAPDFYNIEATKLLFPKDKRAGGTWIGVSEKNRLVCVLNGGFECHERKTNYRMSRGVIAKDFMVAENLLKAIKDYNFFDIEPFTMVIVDWYVGLKFYELVWDENKAHITELPLEPKIWSSTTLYTQPMKEERLQWFEDFKNNHELNSKSMLTFHKTAGKNNSDYGVIMNRGFVKTTSITQVEKQNGLLEMRFESLLNNTQSSTKCYSSETIDE